VFENDFAALLPDGSEQNTESHPLMKWESVQGTCQVVCFSPRHDLSLPEMKKEKIRAVIDVWAEQISELGKRYRWVQVFENKGEIMGCSNPHPHCQIWACDRLPEMPLKEDRQQKSYFEENGQPLLIHYMEVEIERKERLILENENWMWIVPYWAVWPYETLLLPRRHVLRLQGLNDVERDSLSDILKRLLIRYDNLFNTSFPYTMGWHGAPCGKGDHVHWQLHAHFYPPLLRSATVKKFMVGYEMLAEAQRDLTAEQAAAWLREQSEEHYKTKNE
jgi:UDPglucose--hexose-1-phosphate uridylyltransferase